jgi:natural product precursor
MSSTKKMSKISSILPKQTLTKNEMKAVRGGFSCYCGTRYVGEYSSVQACWDAC